MVAHTGYLIFGRPVTRAQVAVPAEAAATPELASADAEPELLPDDAGQLP
jgi:hypothetical protein